jgi:hypothetical protein
MTKTKAPKKVERVRVSEVDRLTMRVFIVLRKDELEKLDKVITPALSEGPTRLLTRNGTVRALINQFKK